MIIPSGGLFRTGQRRVRMLAVLAVRDGMRYLPGLMRNVAPQVEGVIALDDGSSDGSGEFLTGQAAVLEVLRNPVDRPQWDEVGNHRRMVAAALSHGAGWILAIDADERVEQDFRLRAERVIARGRWLGYSGYALRLRELWDDRDHFRTDGHWGRKCVARLFRARTDHEFDTRHLHAYKAPLQARRFGRYPVAEINLYHLGMLTADDRMARRRRYELADPGRQWQEVGYEYLTDERKLRLRKVGARRTFAD